MGVADWRFPRMKRSLIERAAVAVLEELPFIPFGCRSRFADHGVFRAETGLDSKLADFRPPEGDGYAIAASERVERTVTHNPVSSSAPSSPTPDHPAPQHGVVARLVRKRAFPRSIVAE